MKAGKSWHGSGASSCNAFAIATFSSLFVFNQSIAFSSHTVGGHQMCFGGSVVGIASTIVIVILPTPPIIFTGVKKCEIWRLFQHQSPLSCLRLKMQQDIQTLKHSLCVGSPYVLAKFGEVGSIHPWELFASGAPPLKLHGENVTQQWFNRLCSNFVKSLNAWYPNCCKSSRSSGQRSRSQCDITCAKIRQIIHNSAGDCSISLKFCTDFNHVTLDVPRTFKVNGSKIKVTA